jgi:hypothetical protein
VGEETIVMERRVVIVVDDNCMAPGNLKMDILESPMREKGDTPSNTEESEVESKNPLLTLGRKTSFAAAHTSSVHECWSVQYAPILCTLLFIRCPIFYFLFEFFWGGLFFPLSLSFCSAYFVGFVEEEEEHHCSSSSTHPPHLLLLLGNENLEM